MMIGVIREEHQRGRVAAGRGEHERVRHAIEHRRNRTRFDERRDGNVVLRLRRAAAHFAADEVEETFRAAIHRLSERLAARKMNLHVVAQSDFVALRVGENRELAEGEVVNAPATLR